MNDTYDGMNPSDNPMGEAARPDVAEEFERAVWSANAKALDRKIMGEADTIRAEIVQPVIERAVYAVLTVWPLNDESDVFSWGDGSKAANAKRVAEFNATTTSGKSYLIRVPLPPAK